MRFAVLLTLTLGLLSPIPLRAQEKADQQKLSPAQTARAAAIAKIQALGGEIRSSGRRFRCDQQGTKRRRFPHQFDRQ
jgi:hypothetical protein